MSTETETSTTDATDLSHEELTKRILTMCDDSNPMTDHLEAALQREGADS